MSEETKETQDKEVDQAARFLEYHPELMCPDHKRMLVFCIICLEEHKMIK